jgi:hypothetical protein
MELCASNYEHIAQRIATRTAGEAKRGRRCRFITRYISVAVTVWLTCVYTSIEFLVTGLLLRHKIQRLDKNKLTEGYAHLRRCSRSMARLRKHFPIVAVPMRASTVLIREFENAMEKFVLADAVHEALQREGCTEGEWVDWRKVLRKGI